MESGNLSLDALVDREAASVLDHAEDAVDEEDYEEEEYDEDDHYEDDYGFEEGSQPPSPAMLFFARCPCSCAWCAHPHAQWGAVAQIPMPPVAGKEHASSRVRTSLLR